jgi:hypothetical protein
MEPTRTEIIDGKPDSHGEKPYDPWKAPGPNDPPEDLSREEAAYARERDRLVRDHLGKIALIVGDEVVGVYNTLDEGLFDCVTRFGVVKMVLKQICDPNEPPDFISLVDVNHPSVRRLT